MALAGINEDEIPLANIVAAHNMDMVGKGRVTDVKFGGPNSVQTLGARRLSRQFGDIIAAANRGERSAMFLFDESVRTMITRSGGMGMDLQSRIDGGLVAARSIDPAELSPGEFIQSIRHEVEHNDARLVVIDSLSGYLNAMAGEKYVMIQLHELLAYLGSLGVVTILINAQQGLIGPLSTSIDVSYLADTVVMLRYFETGGEVRQAMSVLKKRTGAHERTIRELTFTAQGLCVGEPLRGFNGILTGVPQESHAPAVVAPR